MPIRMTASRTSMPLTAAPHRSGPTAEEEQEQEHAEMDDDRPRARHRRDRAAQAAGRAGLSGEPRPEQRGQPEEEDEQRRVAEDARYDLGGVHDGLLAYVRPCQLGRQRVDRDLAHDEQHEPDPEQRRADAEHHAAPLQRARQPHGADEEADGHECEPGAQAVDDAHPELGLLQAALGEQLDLPRVRVVVARRPDAEPAAQRLYDRVRSSTNLPFSVPIAPLASSCPRSTATARLCVISLACRHAFAAAGEASASSAAVLASSWICTCAIGATAAARGKRLARSCWRLTFLPTLLHAARSRLRSARSGRRAGGPRYASACRRQDLGARPRC